MLLEAGVMHQVARDALERKFQRAAHCAGSPGADRPYFLGVVDAVLDEYLTYRDLATEWDAAEWGFSADGDHWMKRERAALRVRARGRMELHEPAMRRRG